MHEAFKQFTQSMHYVSELDSLHSHLVEHLHLPNDLSDLLRAQWVNSVSALDKLIHDLVRIGMLDTFQGKRPPTPKYLSFGISVSTHTNIVAASMVPPPEYWFEQEINNKHKHLSFQDPDKIADGLSLIWAEQHKWQVIADKLSIPKDSLTKRLKAIVARRNQIAHESDLDPTTGTRIPISKVDSDSVRDIIVKVATEIYNSVT